MLDFSNNVLLTYSVSRGRTGCTETCRSVGSFRIYRSDVCYATTVFNLL